MTRCFLAAVAACGLASGIARAEETAMPFRGLLCDTAVHAIRFADHRARGDSEEVARDRVGRDAEADACGVYRGVATVISETVTLSGGIASKVTAFRFAEDRRVAWLAETSFAPPDPAWSL